MAAAAWQTETVADLSRLLAGDADVRALVLTGSLASTEGIVDAWSDVDARIVLADTALGRYYPDATWLGPLGEIVAWDAVDHGEMKTLRACLVPCRTLDLTFVPLSSLGRPDTSALPPIPGVHLVVWSSIPDLEAHAAKGRAGTAVAGDESGPEVLSNRFWFTAVSAIAKVARDDLLVGGHLALALARDCLVLQMMLRDRRTGTRIHRTGGWGHEILEELAWSPGYGQAAAVLELVSRCARLFDCLAAQVWDGYRPRASLLTGPLRDAATCHGAQWGETKATGEGQGRSDTAIRNDSIRREPGDQDK